MVYRAINRYRLSPGEQFRSVDIISECEIRASFGENLPHWTAAIGYKASTTGKISKNLEKSNNENIFARPQGRLSHHFLPKCILFEIHLIFLQLLLRI